MINGQEVSNMTHEEVVNLIRAARDFTSLAPFTANSQLIITVQKKGLEIIY